MNEEALDALAVKLIRRLKRLNDRKDKLEKEHVGNERNYTYWGGFDLGYVKGKIDEIENMLDELNIDY